MLEPPPSSRRRPPSTSQRTRSGRKIGVEPDADAFAEEEIRQHRRRHPAANAER